MPDRYRILMSKRAAADLQAIFDRIAKDSAANAPKMAARILGAIEDLKRFPNRNVVENQSARVRHPVR